MENIRQLVVEIGDYLACTKESVTTAESCTGGGIAYMLTEQAGSSAWFNQSFVTYSNESKKDLVAVSESVLLEHGAVSEQVVKQMAQGALKAANADYALAVSGIAGPSGGTKDKPVGTVCFAWATKKFTLSETHYFQGDRRQIRIQAIQHSLECFLSILKKQKSPYNAE